VPYDGVTSVMPRAKIRVPQIDPYEVTRFLDDCVGPSSEDPSLLELRSENMLPLFLPWAIRMVREVGQRTPEGQTLIPRGEWDELSSHVNGAVHALAVRAESFAEVDRGPSASDLAQAALADPWLLGEGSSGGLCLFGLRPSLRGPRRQVSFSSRLKGINVDQGWALTSSGWFRLGQRVRGWEFQELCPKHTEVHEWGDEEVKYQLLRNRASIAWQLGQLKLVPRQEVS
jgi:hypothetical protein